MELTTPSPTCDFRAALKSDPAYAILLLTNHSCFLIFILHRHFPDKPLVLFIWSPISSCGQGESTKADKIRKKIRGEGVAIGIPDRNTHTTLPQKKKKLCDPTIPLVSAYLKEFEVDTQIFAHTCSYCHYLQQPKCINNADLYGKTNGKIEQIHVVKI